MLSTKLRAPLLPIGLLRRAKLVFGIVAAGVAVLGGIATFVIAVLELWHAIAVLVTPARALSVAVPRELVPDFAIVALVKSIDALLLGLVQFLLAAFLWQILDPADSLVDEENMLRLEEAKQILCKVVLVIVAVRMLGVLLHPSDLLWTHLLFPAGIVALSFGATSLGRGPKSEAPDGSAGAN